MAHSLRSTQRASRPLNLYATTRLLIDVFESTSKGPPSTDTHVRLAIESKFHPIPQIFAFE
ncbi:hypothetical protein C0Z17_07130 [Trinickia caryophylli]|nr:hypothetical protein C0Z17_07130 [Trinickia caryophylli]